ncbi:MAG TPA: DUF1488 family protein [Frateuria sp.]|uniref:DUF1488 family protein n=1 Tax=Frateuria sp. TaxID=2211372 RepID=UPI002D7FA22D|nr:DUF1488 family protein [Frateuria sp.]HET6804199.1 DUF1488 family protein [Frateuria sp.]
MNIFNRKALGVKPRWDGRRILFTIEIDGNGVPCAISRAALESLGDGRRLSDGDLLPSFVQSYTRIADIAAAIFSSRPDGITGITSVWADDVDDPLSASAASVPIERTRSRMRHSDPTPCGMVVNCRGGTPAVAD